jgi:hypothetical protein
MFSYPLINPFKDGGGKQTQAFLLKFPEHPLQTLNQQHGYLSACYQRRGSYQAIS